MALTFNDNNFEQEVLKSDKLTMVDFWAPWCGPCLALGPTIDALHKEFEGKANIGKLNTDENPQTSVAYGITSIPCILFFKNGKLIDKQVGAVPKPVLERKLTSHL